MRDPCTHYTPLQKSTHVQSVPRVQKWTGGPHSPRIEKKACDCGWAGALGARCDFPLFGLPYPALLNVLFEAGPGVEVQAPNLEQVSQSRPDPGLGLSHLQCERLEKLFSLRSLAVCLTRVDCQTIRKLTCWACCTYLSTLGRNRARVHQVGEPE